MYVTFFGLMMTCLECNIGNLAPKFKKNFGFMFSFAGASGCSHARPPAALAAPLFLVPAVLSLRKDHPGTPDTPPGS